MEYKKAAFCTLGCKVNQYETNAMIQNFIKNGYEIVDFDKKADVYVVNTCTVTNMADRKSRQMLRKVKELNPNSILAAVGCYAQVAKQELEKIPEIDLILGTNEKKDLLKFVEQLELSKKQLIESVDDDEHQKENISSFAKESISDVMHCEEYVDFGDVTFTDKARAVIKVQDGCDRFCSYCIIPYARGHIRSRKPESVVNEITKIAQKGIKEVVITGIHLASYGRDFKNIHNNVTEKNLTQQSEENENRKVEYRLIDLLEEINEIDGIERIRLRFARANTHYGRVCK